MKSQGVNVTYCMDCHITFCSFDHFDNFLSLYHSPFLSEQFNIKWCPCRRLCSCEVWWRQVVAHFIWHIDFVAGKRLQHESTVPLNDHTNIKVPLVLGCRYRRARLKDKFLHDGAACSVLLRSLGGGAVSGQSWWVIPHAGSHCSRLLIYWF